MNTIFENWWEKLLPVHQIGFISLFLVLCLVVVVRIRSKLLKEKIEHFLFNNGYHSVDPKSNAIVFPNVAFTKDQIVIKNCYRKTVDQIRQDKEIWERTFGKRLNGKRIGDIKFDGTSIRLALI